MTGKGYTPHNLIEAIHAGNLSGVIEALDGGTDIETPDMHGHRGLPLRTACFAGNLAIVRELLSRGANPNAVTSDGPGAPLRLAARKGHQDIVALLLQQGAAVPEGVVIPPEVLASPANAVPDEGRAPSPRECKLDNVIEYTPSAIPLTTEEPDSMVNFGTATKALSMELLFLEENATPDAPASKERTNTESGLAKAD